MLSIIAGDRPGLLYAHRALLVKYDINLHTAKINTLGDRAEDVFLINGAALDNAKTVVKLESDLAAAVAGVAKIGREIAADARRAYRQSSSLSLIQRRCVRETAPR